LFKENYSLRTINKTVQKVNPSPIKQSVPIDIKKCKIDMSY